MSCGPSLQPPQMRRRALAQQQQRVQARLAHRSCWATCWPTSLRPASRGLASGCAASGVPPQKPTFWGSRVPAPPNVVS
eukprot:1028665-Pyramimonas_sp.AAC.1